MPKYRSSKRLSRKRSSKRISRKRSSKRIMNGGGKSFEKVVFKEFGDDILSKLKSEGIQGYDKKKLKDFLKTLAISHKLKNTIKENIKNGKYNDYNRNIFINKIVSDIKQQPQNFREFFGSEPFRRY